MTIPSLEEVKKDGGFCFKFVSNDGKINKGMWIKFRENPKKQFVTNGGIFGISVDNLFFEKLDTEEMKEGALWHEFCHSKIIEWLIHKSVSNVLIGIFTLTFPSWVGEYKADKYSALKNNFDGCLSYLTKCSEMYTSKIITKNKKHPPIEKRIARIEKLKAKMENKQ